LSLASRHGQIFKGIVLPGCEHRIDFSANPGDDIDITAADQAKGASGNTSANEGVHPAGHNGRDLGREVAEREGNVSCGANMFIFNIVDTEF
jgi:hypothetical protein